MVVEVEGAPRGWRGRTDVERPGERVDYLLGLNVGIDEDVLAVPGNGHGGRLARGGGRREGSWRRSSATAELSAAVAVRAGSRGEWRGGMRSAKISRKVCCGVGE